VGAALGAVGGPVPRPEKHVFVCLNERPPGHPKGCCSARGGPLLLDEFNRLIQERQAFGRILVTRSGCLKPCELGANVLVYPDGIMYVGVTVADVAEIFDQHLLGGRPVERLQAPPEVWG
jgi:(2Fe-2S) ferredoxin